MYLYPHWLDVTPVEISLTKGLNSDGTNKIIDTVEVSGRLNSDTTYVKFPDGQLIALSGKFYTGTNIFPDVQKIEGYLYVGTDRYKIHKAVRLLNPDGSVNHVKLELI